MSNSEQKPIKASIVTDEKNRGAQESASQLFAKFGLAGSSRVEAQTLEQRLSDPEGIRELQRSMEGQGIVFAALGVPGHSDYKKEIEQLLGAWAGVTRRPALVLVSNDTVATQQLVDAWVASQPTAYGNTLRQAIIVKDLSLLTNAAELSKLIVEHSEIASSISNQLSKMPSLNSAQVDDIFGTPGKSRR